MTNFIKSIGYDTFWMMNSPKTLRCWENLLNGSFIICRRFISYVLFECSAIRATFIANLVNLCPVKFRVLISKFWLIFHQWFAYQMSFPFAYGQMDLVSRFLRLLSEYDWTFSPLIVDINGDFNPNDEKEINVSKTI